MFDSQRTFRTNRLACGCKGKQCRVIRELWEWDKKTTNSRAVKLQDVLNERYKGKNSLTCGSREGPPRDIVQLVGGV